MASWDLLAPESGGDDEPNEDAVPFVMRLDNEGLRIISKMRRINTMVAQHARTHRGLARALTHSHVCMLPRLQVRTHRTWTSWFNYVVKAKKERDSRRPPVLTAQRALCIPAN